MTYVSHDLCMYYAVHLEQYDNYNKTRKRKTLIKKEHPEI